MRENEELVASLVRLTRLLRRRPERGRQGQSARRLLRLIGEHDGARAKTLADLLGIRPPSLTEQLDKLEAQGLAVRERDTEDARVVRVRLTQTGIQEVARMNAGHEEAGEAIAGILTGEERDAVVALLGKLIHGVEARQAHNMDAGISNGEGSN